jgi:hypothetical protein
MLRRMTRRMADGTATRSAPRPQAVRGRTVCITEGTGLVHFSYQSGTRVLWPAILPGPRAAAAIEDLPALYP